MSEWFPTKSKARKAAERMAEATGTGIVVTVKGHGAWVLDGDQDYELDRLMTEALGGRGDESREWGYEELAGEGGGEYTPTGEPRPLEGLAGMVIALEEAWLEEAEAA